MRYLCNPLNVPYPYQFKRDPRDGCRLTVNREAADPSLVRFKGRYFLFASMTGSVWFSEDLSKWNSAPLPPSFPIYDYAPDACVVGDWLYLTASNRGTPCSFYRTRDPLGGVYEEIPGQVDYWDPHLFRDDDGRLYFYWGCSNTTPIQGVELDPATMRRIGEPVALISGDPWRIGYERFGEDHCLEPRTEVEIDALFGEFVQALPEVERKQGLRNPEMIRATFAGTPYIEGPWMTKHEGRYYLQYAAPGAELNVYADGVYVGDSPLGPFELADNNPFSYKPGGFIPGAGHGSTLEDVEGRFWHTATMRISVNHVFERRVGLWPAGFDEDGELFCNQRYGDWPMPLEAVSRDPWAEPDIYLLSYGKVAWASSWEPGNEPGYAVDENVRTWWRAASGEPGQWLMVDLGSKFDVRAVQINFADDPRASIDVPGPLTEGPDMPRYIDTEGGSTNWRLEVSVDGRDWATMGERGEAEADLAHDLVVTDAGVCARYVRLTVFSVPYRVAACVSGLRVFGLGTGQAPAAPQPRVTRDGAREFAITVPRGEGVVGYTVLWGASPDRLYHSRTVMGDAVNDLVIGALVTGRPYTVRVDAFNENGIAHGTPIELKEPRV